MDLVYLVTRNPSLHTKTTEDLVSLLRLALVPVKLTPLPLECRVCTGTFGDPDVIRLVL